MLVSGRVQNSHACDAPQQHVVGRINLASIGSDKASFVHSSSGLSQQRVWRKSSSVSENLFIELTQVAITREGKERCGNTKKTSILESRRRITLRRRQPSSTGFPPLKLSLGSTLCSWSYKNANTDVPLLFVIGGDREPRQDVLTSGTFWDAATTERGSHTRAGKEEVWAIGSYPVPHLVCVGRLYYGRIHPAVVPMSGGKPWIAVIGGCRNGTSVEYFDTDNRTSRVGKPLIEPRYAAGAVLLSDGPNSDILVVGGLTGPWRGAALRSVERVSPSQDPKMSLITNARHTLLADTMLRQAYASHSGAKTARAAVGDRNLATHRAVYASRTTIVMSPSSQSQSCSWTASLSPRCDNAEAATRYCAPMRQARASFGIASLPKTPWILVVGGHNALKGLTSTELYNKEADFWIPGPQLTTPRVNPLIFVSEERQVFVLGGTTPITNKPISTIEMWNARALSLERHSNKNGYGSASFKVVGNTATPSCIGVTVVVQLLGKALEDKYPAKKDFTTTISKVPKLRLYDEHVSPCSQTSLGSTATGGQHSMEISPHITPRDTPKKHLFFEAPRHNISLYFKSRLVEKMRHRGALKSYLWT